MKLAEAWHLSRAPYKEVAYRSIAEERGRMWWGAFGRASGGKEALDDAELAKRALRIAKFDKVIVAVFNIVVSIAPFAPSFLGAAVFELASSVSLSLVATFGFMMLYAIQTLSSFVSAESSALLLTLPVTRDDFSLITLFSFIRSVDYMVIGSILSQLIAVAFLTDSPLATLVMLGASTMNAVFAVTVALWFSRIFQKNLLRGGRSRVNTIFRLIFILMWGLLLVGVGFLFSIPWYIVPSLESTLLGVGDILNYLLSLLYPFSTGIVITDIAYSNVALTTMLLSSAAIVGYMLLVILAGRWSLRTVKSTSQNSGVKVTRVTSRDFSVKIRRPLLGYVLKDLKVASRNPATAFFFVLPVMETVIITLLISRFETLRAVVMLVATFMGGVFSLFLPLSLLTSEGKGLEYTKTLPVSPRRIIVSKALVSTSTYVLVPLALVGLSLAKPLTSFSILLIPFFIIVAVASASIFEVTLFLKTAAKGKIAAAVSDLEKLFVGVLNVLVPEVAYAAVFLSTFNHVSSFLVMGATALAELAAALYTLLDVANTKN
jgi:predicted permease